MSYRFTGKTCSKLKSITVTKYEVLLVKNPRGRWNVGTECRRTWVTEDEGHWEKFLNDRKLTCLTISPLKHIAYDAFLTLSRMLMQKSASLVYSTFSTLILVGFYTRFQDNFSYISSTLFQLYQEIYTHKLWILAYF